MTVGLNETSMPRQCELAIGIPILLAIAAVKHKNGKAEHFFVAACSLAVVLAILSK